MKRALHDPVSHYWTKLQQDTIILKDYAERSGSMFCTNCGAQIPDDSIFCDQCGYRVAGESTGQQAQAGQQDYAGQQYRSEQQYQAVPADVPDGKSSGSKVAVYAVIGVAVLAVAGAGIFFLRKGKSGDEKDQKPAIIAESDAQVSEASGGAGSDEVGKAESAGTVESADEKENGSGAPSAGEKDSGKSRADLKAEIGADLKADLQAEAGESQAEETQTGDEAETSEADISQGLEEAAGEGLTADEMAELAEKLSTTESAMALDFEWAMEYVLYGGEDSESVVADPSQVERITGDMQPLLNGGWKAFMFTKTGDYGSDVERYFNAEILTSDEDFWLGANWNYVFDPGNGTSAEESGRGSFNGSFDAANGTATAAASDARIDFDAFYISKDGKTEYALGKYYWISGEIDQIALMRSVDR